MNCTEKVKFILDTLDKCFPDPVVSLNYNDPFSFLVAVILSAQCTDENVNKVTKELFLYADSPNDMMLLGEEEIERIIRPCGLYRVKSRAIKNMAEQLLEKHNGIVPSNFSDLEALPGVGHKTASVIMSQCFNIPAFPVDTHISRLARRWGLSDAKNVIGIERDLKNVFPENTWRRLHLQMISYGRKYCPARGHCIEKCMICRKLFAEDKN